MALVECPECKKEVSDQSTLCVNCGYPLNKEEKKDSIKESFSHENSLECPIEIKGDEVLKEPGVGFFGGIGIIIVIFAFWGGLGSGEFLGFIIFILISIPLFYIQKRINKPKYEEYNKAKEIYHYFKKKFPILKEFNPEKHLILDNRSFDSESGNIINFDIYMIAHKLGADCIIINDSITSTTVTGIIPNKTSPFGGNIKSKNKFHSNLTFVKYK